MRVPVIVMTVVGACVGISWPAEPESIWGPFTPLTPVGALLFESVPARVPARAPAQAAGRESGRAPAQAAGREPTRAPAQAAGRDPGRAPAQAARPEPGHAPAQAAGREPGRAPAQAAGQTPGHTLGQAAGQAPGHTATAVAIELGNRIQELALDLSAEISEDSTVTFSPISVTALLSVLLLGARDISYQQLYNIFHLPAGIAEASFHKHFQELIESITQRSPGVTINIATGLFLGKEADVLSDFTSSARVHYDSEVRTLDFRDNSVGATKAINEWVKLRTEGMIPELLTQPLSSQTVFVATNTVFFNGTWETPFNPSFTTDAPFETGTETLQVPMMLSILDVPYIDIPDMDAHMIALPYKGGRFAMFILMPLGPVTANLGDLELRLEANVINNLIKNMVNTKVSVGLPRMRLSYKTSLKKPLATLGADSIFHPQKADFSKLTANQQVWVDDVIHETVIEISETGTKAAASSSASGNRVGSTERFVVNRPVIFFIRDLRSGLPLFWGRLIKPEILGQASG
ncbi:leukocyte elastase inhibitor [Procambarus clarkii]|uniref:leukocyte elastase inhibitor n=1 Tax=Procambarus clarkii TaxID=6728 RepID=UPI0037444538